MSVQANIGLTLEESQEENGRHGTYSEDKTHVIWEFNGWWTIEHYDSDGRCDGVTYRSRVGAFSEKMIFGFLQFNTPVGVRWTEEVLTGPQRELGFRLWHSSHYFRGGGLVADSLIARFQIFPGTQRAEFSVWTDSRGIQPWGLIEP